MIIGRHRLYQLDLSSWCFPIFPGGSPLAPNNKMRGSGQRTIDDLQRQHRRREHHTKLVNESPTLPALGPLVRTCLNKSRGFDHRLFFTGCYWWVSDSKRCVSFREISLVVRLDENCYVASTVLIRPDLPARQKSRSELQAASKPFTGPAKTTRRRPFLAIWPCRRDNALRDGLACTRSASKEPTACNCDQRWRGRRVRCCWRRRFRPGRHPPR